MMGRVMGDAELFCEGSPHQRRGIVKEGGEDELHIPLFLRIEFAAHESACKRGGGLRPLAGRGLGRWGHKPGHKLTNQHGTPHKTTAAQKEP
jgi:hypothetical protein